MSFTIKLTEDEYEQRMQAAVEKALKKQAIAAEVDALRRIEAAKAQALHSVKRPTSLFHSFVPTEELLFFFSFIVLTLYGFLRFTTSHQY
jgi:hypothetical protein